jgi:DNA-binding Lrp family transcriptional regulator
MRRENREQYYFKIYEQLHENPTMSTTTLSRRIGISKKTVCKSLKEMYAQEILRGPYIDMKPAQNYREYVYFMKFENPQHAFNELKGFPHVVYHAMLSGDWDTMVITDRLLDFSSMEGFESMGFQGAKRHCTTPRVEEVVWEEGFRKIEEELAAVTAVLEHDGRTAPFLTWHKDEWRLFGMFGNNIRKEITPVVKKTEISYETCRRWKENIKDHCTIHTGFYPKGYRRYGRFCFLFSSQYTESLRKIFSFLPTTTVFMDVGDRVLSLFSTSSFCITRKLLCTFYTMEVQGIVTGFSHAMMLFSCNHRFRDR